ncbi:MAG: IS21 family transposase [Deltaproteobacteria bacterium]|nr:IS21 family transposase [Deltaproteobacteria bacterium]
MRESLWREIHNLQREGLSRRAISRRLGIHRRTVRNALASNMPPRVVYRRRGSIIDPHRGWLLAKLQQYPELTAARLFYLLKERGYEGGSSLVRQVVAELRPRMKPVYQSLHFEPGDCGQVDWGVWQMLDVDGGQRRISFFSIVLCHSRMLYIEFFLGEKMEHWLQAHRNAFEYFGGVPKKVMVDNCKTAVTKARSRTQEAQINSVYQSFADHYGFTITACDPYQPQQKGRTENAVGYVKTAFLGGRPPAPVAALNSAAWHWLKTQANCRTHGTTGKQPEQVFQAEEKPILQPLPPSPHPCASITTVCANSLCRVMVDTNRYSVGPEFGSRRLILHTHADRLRILAPDGTFVCEHLRNYGRKQPIEDPQHVRELAAHNRHSRDEVHIKAFLTLGPRLPKPHQNNQQPGTGLRHRKRR